MFFSRRNTRKCLLVHLGETSVGCALIEITRTQKGGAGIPLIKASLSNPIQNDGEGGSEKFRRERNRALGELLQDFAKTTSLSHQQIHILLSPSDYRAIVTRHEMKSGERKLFVETDLMKFKEEASARPESSGRTFEHFFTYTSIDDYATSVPIGKEGKKLAASFWAASAKEENLQESLRILEMSFHCQEFSFHSEGFGNHLAVRTLYGEKNDYGVLHIGEWVSEFFTVQDGGLTSYLQFPLGRGHLLKNIAVELGIERNEAASLFSLHTARRREDAPPHRGASEIARARTKFYSSLHGALSEIETMDRMSLKKIFVFASDRLNMQIEHIDGKIFEGGTIIYTVPESDLGRLVVLSPMTLFNRGLVLGAFLCATI